MDHWMENYCEEENNLLQKQSPEVVLQKDVLKNCAKLARKQLYQILFFNKVASLRL